MTRFPPHHPSRLVIAFDKRPTGYRVASMNRNPETLTQGDVWRLKRRIQYA